ncbi:spore coat protein [Lysinibacillus endophyticus]|uniref:Spore coat protein n=1 Tax=Ureibacillus endophyticus TaxID=1978490 RepID=A0A494Z7E2_9BACL|nr:spore coat protein [Lysinibacillus endophyticus]MCP1145079.1 spore coat protein [Lysinibacillus endophyticus]RKQ18502.1 spore coat protein [Lysinibacillus endophyticus]
MANEWRALDYWDGKNDLNNDADALQDATEKAKTIQHSHEWIIVRDSEYVNVQTTDTQVALSLQLGIQAALAAVINITLGDTNQGKKVAHDLKQFMRTRQHNSQRTIIENSKEIQVTTTDTDIAVNLQAMIQILVALIGQLDVL